MGRQGADPPVDSREARVEPDSPAVPRPADLAAGTDSMGTDEPPRRRLSCASGQALPGPRGPGRHCTAAATHTAGSGYAAVEPASPSAPRHTATRGACVAASGGEPAEQTTAGPASRVTAPAVDLAPGQTTRSAAFARRRAAEQEGRRAAAAERDAGLVLGGAPGWLWVVLSFGHVLRYRVAHRRRVLARCSALLAPSLAARFVARLRSLVRRRRDVLETIAEAPYPCRWVDVGYDEETGIFSFRAPDGTISREHPAAAATVGSAVPAYDASGSVVAALSPPRESTIVLCPEASGAWCYYDTALGTACWCAPEGSSPLVSTVLVAGRVPPERPPRLPPGVGLGSLDRLPWLPIFRDDSSCVLVYSQLTGSVREAPWICLRTTSGVVYFANLVTRETRWFPPRRWMAGWVEHMSRDSWGKVLATDVAPFDARSPYARMLLPPEVSRRMVDGGAGYHLTQAEDLPPPADEHDAIDTRLPDGAHT